MRDYLPGDDIRSIDWKATARTGKPYVRVFTEERDRPALLVVDQRMSMFFGSRLNMKVGDGGGGRSDCRISRPGCQRQGRGHCLQR